MGLRQQMELAVFTFDAALTEAFIGLGSVPYRHDPGWLPPLEADVRAALAPSGPFFLDPSREHCRFLATIGGRPAARALASIHPGLHDRDGTLVGALGYFESLDDAAGLEVLAAAVEWLHGRGVRRVWGPLQLDIWHGYRFMTRGFEARRYLGEPYNPPRYPELFARFGFVVRQRWNSFELPGRGALEEIAEAGRTDVRRLVAEGYRFESLVGRGVHETLSRLHGALQESFSRLLGFTSRSCQEFHELFAIARWALEERASIFAHGPSGALVAFEASFRDLAAAVRAMKGRSSALARAAFLIERRRARRLLLHLGGLLHHEEARRPGLARAMVSQALARICAAGYEDVLVTLVAEGNPVRRYFGRYASDVRREYALFQLER